MEIWHFENLGYTSVVSECSLGVDLVIDIFLCTSVYNLKASIFGDIAFLRFGGYECRWLRTQLF